MDPDVKTAGVPRNGCEAQGGIPWLLLLLLTSLWLKRMGAITTEKVYSSPIFF